MNNKNCLVEVEFQVGTSEYKIIRGIKPNIFEIYKDDHLINQDSHTKEYQKVLEQNIIKMNYKSFHQVVVLGSSNFIPFMQLQTAHRRAVIEELLDIGVFSKMNQLLKEEISVNKNSSKAIEYKIDTVENKIETQNKYIRDVDKITNDVIKEKENKINEKKEEVGKLEIEIPPILEETEEKDDILKIISSYNDKKSTCISDISIAKNKGKDLARDVKFYIDNDICSTCKQEINEDFRKTRIDEGKREASILMETINNNEEKD